MTNYERFLKFIEFFILRQVGKPWPSFDDLGAEGIYLAALSIPESALSDDWQTKVNQFIQHVTHLRYDDMCKPDWLPFGVIDYRRFRHKYEWAALGYGDDPGPCRLGGTLCKWCAEKLEAAL